MYNQTQRVGAADQSHLQTVEEDCFLETASARRGNRNATWSVNTQMGDFLRGDSVVPAISPTFLEPILSAKHFS